MGACYIRFVDPIALILSVFSLGISLAVAVREFVARPIPFGWSYLLHQKQAGSWEVIGHELHVSNIGRRHLILESAGEMTDAGDGVHAPRSPFAWLPDEPPVSNPEMPRSVAPGDLVTIYIPATYRTAERRFAAQILHRNPWGFLPNQPKTIRKWVPLTSAKQQKPDSEDVAPG